MNVNALGSVVHIHFIKLIGSFLRAYFSEVIIPDKLLKFIMNLKILFMDYENKANTTENFYGPFLPPQ
ncbi:hypothetical protein V1477_007082 [Vespula maculifrons]|uniref:Uncharacterized protein n=1 Tax=Vespula maculifrons TaxID=7453 RepID=A0ABD2CHJ8_VESMC